jgi:hypothetical protein
MKDPHVDRLHYSIRHSEWGDAASRGLARAAHAKNIAGNHMPAKKMRAKASS